jgi:hypothetical protein
MKLIRMLALATFMATLATAQSTTSSGQQPAATSPSPTPTPAATKAGATIRKPSAATGKPQATPSATLATTAKNPAASRKTQTSTKQAPANSKTGAAGKLQSTTGATTGATAGKPPVSTGPFTPAHKGSGPQGAVKTTAKPVAKPVKKTPVVGTIKAKTPAKAVKNTNVAGKTPPPAAGTQTTPPAPEKKAAKRPAGANGRRDPFLSIIRAVTAGAATSNCSTGKRCLSIPELVLQGTVRDISGKMIAVVANSGHRTYTLRENDQVFNGSVEKITTDSIIFREFVKDALGRESAREVVKKMSPTS